MPEHEQDNGMGKNRCLAIEILEFFEDMLEEKDITIPDEDRTGDESEARLYGMTYADLEDRIADLLDRSV